MRYVGMVLALVLLAAACSGTESTTPDADEGTAQTETALDSEPSGVDPAIAEARLTIRIERPEVTINGTSRPGGAVLEGVPGDVIEVDHGGGAVLTGEAVFELEALRGARVTVPDLGVAPAVIELENGHIHLRANPEIGASLTVDTGSRQFAASTDAEFTICQDEAGTSCLVVVAGEVTWIEDGVSTETYSAGRATSAPAGGSPHTPRCADIEDVNQMRTMLRDGSDQTLLVDLIDTWSECTDDESDLVVAARLPSAARMEQIILDTQQLGSPDLTADSANGRAPWSIDDPVNYFIEPLTTTNVEFRTWLANIAGNEVELWERHAPQTWLDRAPGGAVTQAIYASDAADEAVTGISFETAQMFCEAQNKRLPTEIEWELAATNDVLEDLRPDGQDWVTDWEAYGEGPGDTTDRQVLRGANAVLEPDPYYRNFAVTSAEANAARRHARIRCAASEVAIGGQTFTNVVLQDDFNSLDWPEVVDDPLELNYHPENYHLDLSGDHSQGAVVRALDDPLDAGRIDTDLFIERSNTGSGAGGYRFGTLFGKPDQLLTLTIQPDEFSRQRFLACLLALDPVMVEALELDTRPLDPTSDGRPAKYGIDRQNHTGEKCVGAETAVEVPVSDIDNPVRISVVLENGELEAWVNDVVVASFSELNSIEIYGFYSQTYERTRTHIHYDDLIIKN